MNFTQITQSLESLKNEELLALNRIVVERIRMNQTITAAAASTNIAVGSLIKFHKTGRGRHAGTHYVRVSGFNRARTAVIGYETDRHGKQLPLSSRWTVDADACTVVS